MTPAIDTNGSSFAGQSPSSLPLLPSLGGSGVAAGPPQVAALPDTESSKSDPISSAEDVHGRVGRLLEGLQQSSPRAKESNSPASEVRFENRLAVVRLGMATSLFYALRTKHAATAAHCLRVALSCSAWTERMKLDDELRDRIEVAALLHDLGKIGIPDRILRKPGKLTVDEQLSMDLIAPLGCEILRGCTGDQELLDIVLYAGTWFDGRRLDDGPSGAKLPIGSRMLSIADAFDSMTTDTVYRPALSRERALEELNKGGHTQFDPELVADFSRMLEERPELLQGCVVNRWLHGLADNKSQSMWTGPANRSTGVGHAADASRGRETLVASQATRRESLFYHQLLDNMKDGVVFTDAEGIITRWNDVMHVLTSITAEAIVGKRFSNETLRLRDVSQNQNDRDECLVSEAVKSGLPVTRSLSMEQPGREATPVQMTVTPVSGDQPGVHGSVIIFRDMSDQKTMQRRIETLHEKSTQDALTKVANRAHFDEKLKEMTSKASRGKSKFSLIICDIDHFKSVNDTHGHPAGDEALVKFAAVLKAHSRDGDLVARYGGEEFLLVADNCDNATAASRAESIRAALEKTPLPSLNNESVTASFGVTQFQAGDTAESVLARSDRALLKAKDNGRNRVIQLGSGSDQAIKDNQTKLGWFNWLSGSSVDKSGEFDIVTPVPVDLAIEKLRGFIADHGAEIIVVKENQVSIKVNATYCSGGRRRVDQRMAIQAQLTLSETAQDRGAAAKPGKSLRSLTNVHVNLKPLRNRDRRGRDVSACYSQVISSLRSYLMGELKQQES
jgi:diguanylate cyclase (GGDEF)-like protein/PAS domain S-box-containing protein